MRKAIPNARNPIKWRDLLWLTIDTDHGSTFRQQGGMFYVQIPSDRGGRLRVGFDKLDSGDNELQVVGSNGKRGRTTKAEGGEIRIAFAEGTADDGICLIDVKSPSGRFKLWAIFEEIGVAREANGKPLVPWNFFFYPFSKDEPDHTVWTGAKLQPLQKYEQATGNEGALAWEQAHHADPGEDDAGNTWKREDWEGHCNAMAPASIIFQAPAPGGRKWHGAEFTCEELKFFGGEYFARFGEFETGATWWLPPDYGSGAPGGRGGWRHESFVHEKPKKFGVHFAELLEFLNRAIMKGGHALMMDMRYHREDRSVARAREVWNHAVYRYRVVYWQSTGTAAEPNVDLRRVQVIATINANADIVEADFSCSGTPATTGIEHGEVIVKPNGKGRDLHLEGQLQFDSAGAIDIHSEHNRWFRVHRVGSKGPVTAENHYPPRTALYVKSVSKKGRADALLGLQGNPLLERQHVLQLLRLRKKFR